MVRVYCSLHGAQRTKAAEAIAWDESETESVKIAHGRLLDGYRCVEPGCDTVVSSGEVAYMIRRYTGGRWDLQEYDVFAEPNVCILTRQRPGPTVFVEPFSARLRAYRSAGVARRLPPESGPSEMTLVPPLYVLVGECLCWRCKRETQVVGLAVQRVREFSDKDYLTEDDEVDDEGAFLVLSHTTFLPEAIREALARTFPTYWVDRSRMDGNDYYANHCDCGAAFEDYSLFEEMGSPFMPMSAEDASRVRVYPVVERFEFQGSCQPTLGTAGDWLSVYGEFSAWDSISDCVSPDVVMAHDLLQRDNLTLRVRELAEMRDRASSRFEIALEAAGSSMRMLGTHEHFDLWPEPEITSSLRWYFEESPSDDQTPEAEHGARLDRVGRGMAEMGSRLFGHLFRSTRVACDAWCCVRDRLHDIRVEIVVTTLRSRAMPWELLLSDRGEHLALACKSFVVGTSEIPETREWAVPSADEPLRVLLVTCRLKVDDIPRDVMANALVDAVSTGAASTVRIEHLRPPTFRKLREVLLRAALRGAPFHVVHFDGHGTFVEDETPEAGRGAVIFEHAQMPFQYVDGRELAAVLKDARVPWLVMNACQSARLDAPQLGTPLRSVDADPGLDHPAKSLGREALEEGLIGVVAMRYKVEVKTACVFYGAFYEALASGAPVGVAANHGRRRLEMGWHKEGRLKLEGLIPVVYEAMPFSLFRDRHEWMQLVDELRATPRDDDGVRSPAP